MRSQRGTALVEVTWLSVLLLLPLVYVVLTVFEVQRAAFGASVAARAAGRAYATAPTESMGVARARLAAATALADQGADPDRLVMTLTCRPDPGNCLAPGAVIEVDVRYDVRLPLMPSALGDATPRVRISASHRVPYGTFREDR